MKKLTFKLLVILLIANQTSFAQIIPNASFEQWTTVSGVEKLNGWITSQELNCTPVSSSKTTDKVDSNYALMIETGNCALAGGLHEGYAIAIFPIASKPLYLNGWYKSVRVNSDSAQIKVVLKKSNNIIGESILNITGSVSTYQPFSIPLNYNSTVIPDGAEIYILSDRVGFSKLGNKLWVDKLSFSSNVGLKESSNLNQEISVFPVPSTKNITIKTNIDFVGLNYNVYDMLGNKVLIGKITDESTNLNIENFIPGIYLLQFGDTRQTIRIIKQ
ncbi:MAG: T9SS type A sorting domain-containing protein [Bacteroidia bacterium]